MNEVREKPLEGLSKEEVDIFDYMGAEDLSDHRLGELTSGTAICGICGDTAPVIGARITHLVREKLAVKRLLEAKSGDERPGKRSGGRRRSSNREEEKP